MKKTVLLLAILLLTSVIVGCFVIGGPKAPEEKIDAQSLLDPENPKYYGIAAGLSAGLYSEPERLHIVSFLSAPIFTDVCVEADAAQAPKQVALLQGSGILRKIKTADLNALLTEHFGITAEQAENKSGMFYDAKEDVYYFREATVPDKPITAEGMLTEEDGVTQKAVYKTVLDNKECYVAVTLKETESGYIITSCVKAPNNILDEPTAPTKPKENEPGETEPEETEPEETGHEWLTEPVEYLTYEEFFGEKRSMTLIETSWGAGDYRIASDAEGFFIFTLSGGEKTVHRVPNTEWAKDYKSVFPLLSDGWHLYCVRGSNEIVRIELLNGNTEVLYSGGEIMCWPEVYREGAMYFAVREQDAVVIYLLYIPEQKLVTLYDQIRKDVPKFPWFGLLVSDCNWGPIGYEMITPEMQECLDEMFADSNNKIINELETEYGDIVRNWDDHTMEVHRALFEKVCMELREKRGIQSSTTSYLNNIEDIVRPTGEKP